MAFGLEANSKTRAAKPAGDSSKERATEEVGAFMVLMTITTAMRRTPLSKCGAIFIFNLFFNKYFNINRPRK
jgi:hypothetical protein